VDITFDNKKLEEYANNDNKGKKGLGLEQYKKYKQRLEQLATAINLEELRNTPGKFHELTENRKGQWACTLNANYRLVFSPQEEPIPTTAQGSYDWSEIKAVVIIEIVDYH
jgi:proteic killer suppression protein